MLAKFILPAVIRDTPELADINYEDRANQVADHKLFVGLMTRSVRAFYTAGVAYILKWFPLKEPVVKDSQFVNFFTKEKCDFGMVATFVQRYPALLDFKNEDLNKLNEEFIDYQTLSREDIPTSVWDEASERVDAEGGGISWRMDTVWGYLRGLKLPGVEVSRFPMLSKVAQVVLTIPHSNAGEERVFSIIRKIRRDDRGSMQLEGTLSSLITVKINLSEPCFKYQPSKRVLDDAKQATSLYNKQHSNKQN